MNTIKSGTRLRNSAFETLARSIYPGIGSEFDTVCEVYRHRPSVRPITARTCEAPSVSQATSRMQSQVKRRRVAVAASKRSAPSEPYLPFFAPCFLAFFSFAESLGLLDFAERPLS